MGAVLRGLRRVPARPALAVLHGVAGHGYRRADGRALRLSRNGGEAVFHYSFLSTFADACVVPERSCVPIPRDVPFEIAGLVGCAVSTGVGAVWRTAGVRPGDRVAVLGCGGVGLSALMAAVAVGAEPVIAVDVAPQKLDVARSFGATAGVLWQGGPEETAAAIRTASSGGVDYAIEATGRPEAMLAAFLGTRARGAAVLIGIPRAEAVVALPALSIPRMERRVLGSIYGSTFPERDFGTTLDLYRSGRLPLDRLARSIRSTRWPWPAIVTATRSAGPSPTPAMRSCWPTFCAPTATRTDRYPQTPNSPPRCGYSPAPSRTPSGIASRSPTSSVRCCASTFRPR